MASIGEMFANLWDMLCQIWDFVLSIISGLYLAINSLVTSVPLAIEMIGLVGGFIAGAMILFLMTYVVKFIVGR